MAKSKSDIVGMQCTVCKSRNYVTTRNKTNMDTSGRAKLELKKYCKTCGKVQIHKEVTRLK